MKTIDDFKLRQRVRRAIWPTRCRSSTHAAVLAIDEVSYLTYGTDAANMLFHVVNERLHVTLENAMKEDSDQEADLIRISGMSCWDFPEPTHVGATSSGPKRVVRHHRLQADGI